jgi:hypothetical protein
MHRWLSRGLAALALIIASDASTRAAPRRAALLGDVPKPAATAPQATPPLSPGLAQKLASGDPEQIKAALDEARLAGKGAAKLVPAIVDQLERGMPFNLAEAAIDTLGDIASETAEATAGRRPDAEPASVAIAPYLHHRSVSLRRAAARALVHTKGAAAAKGLRAALSDQDAAVRGTAATGLGALKAKEAVADLFVALDHRVNEAAASIGQLCSPDECDALASRMGKVPFDVITSGLDPILFRPASEVGDDAKVKLVGRVRELGTGEANKFLRDVQKRWPATWSPRIKQAIDQGVLATAAAPGTPTGAP